LEWNRAKNFMLVFFLLANLLLAALIRYETGGYTLTRERENVIWAVFDQNNIAMYASIPRSFAPMRALQVSGYDYDFGRLLAIFFPYGAEPAHVYDDNRDEFTWGDARLVISNGYISFVSGETAAGTPNRDAAIALSQAFINEHYPDFRLDVHSIRYVRRGVRIFYRQEHQGHLIHTNFVEFLVTGEGDELLIEEVDIQYGRPLGFAYMPRVLAGPDEALLTFVQNVRRRGDEPILIRHMDIAYFQVTPGSRDVYTAFYAEPFYRIFVEGQTEPFLVSAYGGQMR